MAETRPIVLLTGATGGIGKTLSRHLGNQGYDLLLCARDESRLNALAQQICSESKVNAIACPVDLGRPETFASVWEHLASGLDGLVLMPPQLDPTADCLPDPSFWRDAFQQSFIGPLDFIKAAIPHLRQRARSKVVIISGISSVQVLSHYATSNVLRAAWLAQAKTLAFAYGPERIHFNTLSLGGVLTDEYRTELQSDAVAQGKSIDELLSTEVDNVPLRKYAEPREVSVAVEGLLSGFSDHITGVNILCDGGFTRAY